MASKARGPALHPPAGEAWRKAGEWEFDATLLQAASSPDLVVEYRVPDAERGTTQGNALTMVGKTGQATRAGAWIEAAHIAASCPAYDSFVANSPTIGSSGLQLYHFCARAPCAVRSPKMSPTAHIAEWRVLGIGASRRLPWARAGLRAFEETLKQAGSADSPMDQEELGGAPPVPGTPRGAGRARAPGPAGPPPPKSGAPGGRLGREPSVDSRGASLTDEDAIEEVAAGEVLERVSGPQRGDGRGGAAEMVWENAMRPPVDPRSDQIQMDQALADDLSRSFASADRQAAQDARTAGRQPGPGLAGQPRVDPRVDGTSLGASRSLLPPAALPGFPGGQPGADTSYFPPRHPSLDGRAPPGASNPADAPDMQYVMGDVARLGGMEISARAPSFNVVWTRRWLPLGGGGQARPRWPIRGPRGVSSRRTLP